MTLASRSAHYGSCWRGYLGSACSSELARRRAPLLWERKRREGSGRGPGSGAGTHCSVELLASWNPPRLLLSEKPPPCKTMPMLQTNALELRDPFVVIPDAAVRAQEQIPRRQVQQIKCRFCLQCES